MITTKTIRIGTVAIPAGTNLAFSTEGYAVYKGKKISKSMIIAMEAEGFRLKVKGVPGTYATDKVFATKEEAKAYAEHMQMQGYVSIVKQRDTPTKAELQQEERQKRAQERRAKRYAKPEPRRKKPTYEDWADSQAAGKMFREIRSQLDITPDANFPSKTSFIKWVDSMWDKLTEE